MRAVLAALILCASFSITHAETASWYGRESGGPKTASGERFDPNAMTAAHRTLPFGTHVRVCRGIRCVVVRINDRGPFIRGRDFDLSLGAARAIGLPGVGKVSIEMLHWLPCNSALHRCGI
jgi:rare lipoprotein A